MNLELIHKYLNKEMSSQEHAAFELKMLKDAELGEEVALQKDMIAFLDSENKTSKARQTIKDIGETYRPTIEKEESIRNQANKSKLHYLIPISIAALFLIGFFMKQTMIPQKMTGEDIYVQYAEISNLSFATRSDENDNLLLTAQNAFNDKDYKLAVSQFEKIRTSNPNNVKALYYQAYAKINSDDIAGGRQDLSKLFDNPQYKNSALYQLGLSFIKTDQYTDAIDTFEKIDNTSNHFKMAQEIIELIK